MRCAWLVRGGSLVLSLGVAGMRPASGEGEASGPPPSVVGLPLMQLDLINRGDRAIPFASWSGYRRTADRTEEAFPGVYVASGPEGTEATYRVPCLCRGQWGMPSGKTLAANDPADPCRAHLFARPPANVQALRLMLFVEGWDEAVILCITGDRAAGCCCECQGPVLGFGHCEIQPSTPALAGAQVTFLGVRAHRGGRAAAFDVLRTWYQPGDGRCPSTRQARYVCHVPIGEAQGSGLTAEALPPAGAEQPTVRRAAAQTDPTPLPPGPLERFELRNGVAGRRINKVRVVARKGPVSAPVQVWSQYLVGGAQGAPNHTPAAFLLTACPSAYQALCSTTAGTEPGCTGDGAATCGRRVTGNYVFPALYAPPSAAADGDRCRWYPVASNAVTIQLQVEIETQAADGSGAVTATTWCVRHDDVAKAACAADANATSALWRVECEYMLVSSTPNFKFSVCKYACNAQGQCTPHATAYEETIAE